MKKITKQIFKIYLMFSFLISSMGNFAYAQDENLANIISPESPAIQTVNTEPQDNSVNISDVSNPIDATETIDPIGVSEVPKPVDTKEDPSLADASDVQQAIDEPVIQDTISIQDGATTEDISSTTGDVEIVQVDQNPNQDETLPEDTPTEGDTVTVDDNQNIDPLLDEVVAEEEPLALEEPVEEVPVVEIRKPKPVYTFSVVKKTIPTYRKDLVKSKRSVLNNLTGKKSLVTEEKIVESSVSDIVKPDVNQDTGDMVLSGSCASTYFVVLLYKNETDYKENANSYILNKAFPCENNSFSYTVSKLPENLVDGNYYILIGEQGDTGTWKPASQLTEINLNRN